MYITHMIHYPLKVATSHHELVIYCHISEQINQPWLCLFVFTNKQTYEMMNESLLLLVKQDSVKIIRPFNYEL